MTPDRTKTRIALAVLLSLLFAGGAAQAASRVDVAPNRVVVQVKGIVCSFCAHGAEKSLKNLGCLDKAQFGSDGVQVDIDNQQIILAIKPRQVVPIREIHDKIRDAGYDPVRMHLRVAGKLVKTNGGLVLSTDSGQRFALTGKLAKGLPVGKRVEVQGYLDAAAMKASAKAPAKLTVERKI